LPDVSLPGNGPGRAEKGNFALSGLRLEWIAQEGATPRPVPLSGAVADPAQGDQAFSAEQLTDDNPSNGWAIGGEVGAGHEAIVAFAEPITTGPGAQLVVKLEQQYGSKNVLGRFRISAANLPDPAAISPLSTAARALLARSAAERSPDEQAQLRDYFRRFGPNFSAIRARVAELQHTLPPPPITLVMQELETPRTTHVHMRGAYLTKGEEVQPAPPAILNPLPPDAPLNRLTFARWLVSSENPLTARVTVNRLWEQYFGQGIVATSEDFGTQGEPPSHPELLDWLATEFIDRGWSLKQVHRLIATSATYRQDARVTPELAERDPRNRLLARGPRIRLEAEMLRDQALAVSGLLSRKMFGPSVMPPQPEGVWQVVYSGDQWITSQGEDKYRRGIYTFWRRTSPYPSMITFDG